MDKVQIETDSLLVVHGLNSDSNVSYFDMILLNIIDMCSQFTDVNISFAKRSANQIAYLLAQKSLFMLDSLEWISTLPILSVMLSLMINIYLMF